MNKSLNLLLFLVFGALLMACDGSVSSQNLLEGATSEGGLDVEEPSPAPDPEPVVVEELDWPVFDWDNKHSDYEEWNEIVFKTIDVNGPHLLTDRPSDILSFCPNYDNLNDDGKKMFWISLLAAMTRFESGFDPTVSFTESFNDSSGNRVVSRGLLQLSIESALGYRCPLNNAQELHDPEKNLECAVRIMDRWVDRDGVITDRPNGNWRGGARYWSVLRRTDKLDPIREKTSGNEVCQL